MVQMRLRRPPPKHHRARNALLTAGAVGVAAGSWRRFRHRKHHDAPVAGD